MGRDTERQEWLANLERVSIHAPAWGATSSKARLTQRMKMFQSTRPHGARLVDVPSVSVKGSFNPRARMGRDDERTTGSSCVAVSIHAPAWGATSILAP